MAALSHAKRVDQQSNFFGEYLIEMQLDIFTFKNYPHFNNKKSTRCFNNVHFFGIFLFIPDPDKAHSLSTYSVI